MENQSSDRQLYKIDFSNIPHVLTFGLFLAILFEVIKADLYYEMLLHISIFQYMDVSEIALLSAETGVVWVLYLGPFFILIFLWNHNKPPKFIKAIIYSLLLAFQLLIMLTAYKNNPLFAAKIDNPFGTYWAIIGWLIFIPTTMLGSYFFNLIITRKLDNKIAVLIISLVLVVGIATFECFMNYSLVTGNYKLNDVKIKFNSGVVLETNNITVSIGRTKNYWFFYNRKTKIVRVIKNDSVNIVDFK